MNRDPQNRVVQELELKECISCLDFSENQLALGLVDEQVLIYNFNGSQTESEHLFRFSENSLGVVDLKYDLQGKLLAVSCLDSCIRVYNTEEGNRFSQIQCDPMQSYKICFDDRNLVSCGEMGRVDKFDIETQELVQQYKTSDAFVQAIDISPNNRYLGLGNCLGHVFLIEQDSKKIFKLECHGKQVRGIKFLNDSQQMVSVSDDLHINMIDNNKMQVLLTLTGHKSNINSVDVNPQNPNSILTSSYDKTVKVWDLRTNQIVHNIHCHSDNVWAAKFNKQGNTIASGSENGQLFIHSLT